MGKRRRRADAQVSPVVAPTGADPGPAGPAAPVWLAVGLPALLAVAAFACFSPALSNDWVNWDDYTNFLENPNWRGFGAENLAWMFTTHNGHYIPLTWLTLALDFKLWGLDPKGYHLTSLVLNSATTVLLYFLALALLRRLPARDAGDGTAVPVNQTRLRIAAALAASLHALHPLRVESVAWITERRDVLCGAFVLASVLAYLRMQDQARPRARRRWWALSVALFLLSLVSKVLGITLPVVLLIIDVYPLRRLAGPDWRGRLRGILVEKVPYGALAAVALAMGIVSEKAAGAWVESDAYTIWHRLLQPGHRVCFYLGKMLLPIDLSPLYLLWPVPTGTEPRFIAGTAGALAITVVLVALRRRWPAGLAAWAAFVVLLLPVLGFVQIGAQYAADRFTYLAAIPWALLAGGGILRAGRRTGLIAAAVAAVVVVGLGMMSVSQTRIWKDSLTLWNHALGLHPDMFLGYNNRGLARRRTGDVRGALADYDQALALNPQHLSAHMNRGIARADLADWDGAIADFEYAMRVSPRPDVAQRVAIAHGTRGGRRLGRNDTAGAITDLELALRLLPRGAPGRNDFQTLLARARAQRTGP